MLPGRMSPWQLASVKDCPRNMPLKFGQNRFSNSWDIIVVVIVAVDVVAVVVVVVVLVIVHFITFEIWSKSDHLTAEILMRLSSRWWVVVVYSHFHVKPNFRYVGLSFVVVELGLWQWDCFLVPSYLSLSLEFYKALIFWSWVCVGVYSVYEHIFVLNPS